MWGNPRPEHTTCASDSQTGVFRSDTAVTRENIASHESHDTPQRRAGREPRMADSSGENAPRTLEKCCVEPRKNLRPGAQMPPLTLGAQQLPSDRPEGWNRRM